MRSRLALVALLGGHVLSRTGNVVAVFAVPFLVLSMGGSAIEVGVAAAAGTLPVVVAAPIGGMVIDRFGALRTSIVADIVSGATVALIPVLWAADGLSIPVLLTLLFVGGLLDAPGETARRVVLPELSSAAGVRMEQSVGFLDATTRMSSLLGAPLAGLLVAWIGPAATFGVTAVTFVLSAVTTIALAVSPAGRILRVRAEPEDGSLWQRMSAGVRFLVKDPVLRVVIGLVLVTNMFDAARGGTLMPLYAAEELGGAAALGVISGCFGGAALAGSVLFGFIAHRVPRRPVIVLGFLGAAVPSLLAPALGAGVWGMIVAALISGLCAGSLNPTLGAIQLERIPEHLRGRVFGATSAGAWAGMPLGSLLGGISADLVGVRVSFGILLVLYTAVALIPVTGGAWKWLNPSRSDTSLPPHPPTEEGR